MAVVRTTVEIFRPVPLRPVEVSARVERPGHRVQLLSATLTDGNTELCRATAWRMRIADLTLGELTALEVPFAGPADSVAHVPESDDPAFHRTGMEMRYAHGSFAELGPATVWMRLTRSGRRGSDHDAIAARPRRCRFWERRLGGCAMGGIPVHQHRSHRVPASPTRGRVDLPRRQHRCRPPRCRRRSQPAVRRTRPDRSFATGPVHRPAPGHTAERLSATRSGAEEAFHPWVVANRLPRSASSRAKVRQVGTRAQRAVRKQRQRLVRHRRCARRSTRSCSQRPAGCRGTAPRSIA